MIIAISGSVGSGKTTIATELSKKLDYKLINLNKLAESYKIEEIN
jgi:cytidylate kinase